MQNLPLRLLLQLSCKSQTSLPPSLPPSFSLTNPLPCLPPPLFLSSLLTLESVRRDQFAYMTLMLCRHYAPNLEAPFKVYVFNLRSGTETQGRIPR